MSDKLREILKDVWERNYPSIEDAMVDIKEWARGLLPKEKEIPLLHPDNYSKGTNPSEVEVYINESYNQAIAEIRKKMEEAK